MSAAVGCAVRAENVSKIAIKIAEKTAGKTMQERGNHVAQ